ncbi:MAG: hypothetical protein Ct9H90mP20_1340 [Candidatus Neomarinimicrobiota bacterium]|nr:MAG: hypothetical protein Ct9H90mP20_1340 [Candidatus Neomarinimicrobiota bacterium]
MYKDTDPQETREWLESIEDALEEQEMKEPSSSSNLILMLKPRALDYHSIPILHI